MSGVSTYTEEIADIICERIADGESLRRICRDDEMPSTSTVLKWLNTFPLFSTQYARAREAQADAIFDEILDIADDGLNDTYTDGDGQIKTNQDVIARSRLRIDARKWMAGKLRPKKYGDIKEPESDGVIRVEVINSPDSD